MQYKSFEEIESILVNDPPIDTEVDDKVYESYEELKRIIHGKLESFVTMFNDTVGKDLNVIAEFGFVKSYEYTEESPKKPFMMKKTFKGMMITAYDKFNKLLEKHSYRRCFTQSINIIYRGYDVNGDSYKYRMGGSFINIDIERSHRKGHSYGKWVLKTNIQPHVRDEDSRPLTELILQLFNTYIGFNEYNHKETRRLYDRERSKLIKSVEEGYIDDKIFNLIKLAAI